MNEQFSYYVLDWFLMHIMFHSHKYLTSKVYLFVRYRICLIPKIHGLDRSLIIINIAIQNFKHSYFFLMSLFHKCFFKETQVPNLQWLANFYDIPLVQYSICLKFKGSIVRRTGIPLFRYTICTKVIKTSSHIRIYHFTQ